ncbi:hypothetical protein [Nocardioides coralli]|uniref:hypothetical protein n=1 Tax=Nocardioides coralli TaxID=2872154 RepID=UPI001CA44FCC|nr:hypothetical protein [Nocardioides coralli]QZY29657.1 hypothetical protein K6T13_02895 [Nocardioides coralli]
MLQGRDRQVGTFAWVMAWVGLVVGQLHALARFRTPEGLKDVDPDEYPWTAAWAVPADDLLSPLLDWASPEQVYVHYGKVWFPVLAAVTLCALVVYRRRQPRGFERGAWWAAIATYAAGSLGVFLDYWTQWSGDYEGNGIEATLFTIGAWISFPALFLMMLTTTVLGVTLLIRRFRPALPAILMVSTIPFAFLVVMQVTSLGSVFLTAAFAFGVLGRRIARADGPVPDRTPVSA